MTAESDYQATRSYRKAYQRLRRREGRGEGGAAELLALPFLTEGSMAKQWQVHARSYETFVRRVLGPVVRRAGARNLDVLDLGAGNGWLCYRLSSMGHRAVAVDLRLDTVDGLGAGAPYRDHLDRMFPRVAALFDRLPCADATFDLAVFASSLHCASDLGRVLEETARVVRPGGRVVILDSPFYRSAAVGEAMVAEREQTTREHLPDLADGLLAMQSIEYLTRDRLRSASISSGITWRRHRVLYPLWYELRPIKARLRRVRPPSRFDVWQGSVP